MFADERKVLILEQLSLEGSVKITDLAKRFNVSTETIRRDLSELADAKKLKKVHGGAVAIKHIIHEKNYETRIRQNYEAKKRIGQYAAELIGDDEVIFLDNGATTEEIAKSIYNRKGLTLVINSLTIGSILAQKQVNGDFTGKIIFVGGIINSDNLITTGVLALSVISRLSADKAFIGATSISKSGIMMWDENDGEYSAALCRNANETYLVADSSKFGNESFYKFLDFSQIDHIITDDENRIDAGIINAADSNNVKFHLVKRKF